MAQRRTAHALCYLQHCHAQHVPDRQSTAALEINDGREWTLSWGGKKAQTCHDQHTLGGHRYDINRDLLRSHSSRKSPLAHAWLLP